MVFISNRGHEDDLATTSVTRLIARVGLTDLLARQVFPSSLTAPCMFLWKLYTLKHILPRIEEGQCLVKGILESVLPRQNLQTGSRGLYTIGLIAL